MAEYVRYHDCPAILDLMDAFSFGARQRAEKANWLERWFWKREESLIRSFESSIQKKFSRLAIISELDRQRLDYLNKEIYVINNGIDQNFFKSINKPEVEKFDAVFVGNMGYYPNIKAVEYITKNILPAYETIHGAAIKVNIAGPNQKHINHLNHHNLVKSGYYPEVADAYASGTVFLAPLFEGIGQQNKILEAMAIGIPCIATPDVCEALQMTPGEHLLVAEDVDAFCGHIHMLMGDSSLRSTLVHNAKNFVRSHYSWEKANLKLIGLIRAASK
jgi:glycosyltransferase involved in cell wall biosynthesis